MKLNQYKRQVKRTADVTDKKISTDLAAKAASADTEAEVSIMQSAGKALGLVQDYVYQLETKDDTNKLVDINIQAENIVNGFTDPETIITDKETQQEKFNEIKQQISDLYDGLDLTTSKVKQQASIQKSDFIGKITVQNSKQIAEIPIIEENKRYINISSAADNGILVNNPETQIPFQPEYELADDGVSVKVDENFEGIPTGKSALQVQKEYAENGLFKNKVKTQLQSQKAINDFPKTLNGKLIKDALLDNDFNTAEKLLNETNFDTVTASQYNLAIARGKEQVNNEIESIQASNANTFQELLDSENFVGMSIFLEQVSKDGEPIVNRIGSTEYPIINPQFVKGMSSLLEQRKTIEDLDAQNNIKIKLFAKDFAAISTGKKDDKDIEAVFNALKKYDLTPTEISLAIRIAGLNLDSKKFKDNPDLASLWQTINNEESFRAMEYLYSEETAVNAYKNLLNLFDQVADGKLDINALKEQDVYKTFMKGKSILALQFAPENLMTFQNEEEAMEFIQNNPNLFEDKQQILINNKRLILNLGN